MSLTWGKNLKRIFTLNSFGKWGLCTPALQAVNSLLRGQTPAAPSWKKSFKSQDGGRCPLPQPNTWGKKAPSYRSCGAAIDPMGPWSHGCSFHHVGAKIKKVLNLVKDSCMFFVLGTGNHQEMLINLA